MNNIACSLSEPSVSRVNFRAYRDADFDTMAEIRRDSFMHGMLMAVPQHTDDQAVLQWIERRQNEPGGLFRVIADARSDEALGFIQIGQIHHRNRTGYGGMAVAQRLHRRGLGREAISMIVKLGREELKLRKLMSEIRADNFAAIKLNLEAGYRIIGTISRHFVDAEGQAHDVLLVERNL